MLDGNVGEYIMLAFTLYNFWRKSMMRMEVNVKPEPVAKNGTQPKALLNNSLDSFVECVAV